MVHVTTGHLVKIYKMDHFVNVEQNIIVWEAFENFLLRHDDVIVICL